MKLLELEREMASAVMAPLTGRYLMRKRTKSGESVAALAEQFIKPNSRLSAFERLEIYNRQYWFRILSAFAEDFPALEAMIGKRRFQSLAKAYLTENPSRSFTLRNLGSKLESWLRANPGYAGEQLGAAIDLVRLEWAYVEAFDGSEMPVITPADAAQIGLDSVLTLQPHLRLLRLGFALDDFIIAVHNGQVSLSVASNAFTAVGGGRKRRHVVFSPEEIYLAVHRYDHLVYYKRLEKEAFQLLQSLSQGHPLGMALETAFAGSALSEAERAPRIQQWFSNWAELGWFCRDGKPGR